MLVAVATKGGSDRWSVENSLEELAQLADTAGATVVGKLIQRLPVPSTTHYLGKGKIIELISLKDSLNYNVAIFDDELTPRQQQNLEEILKVKVIDRAALILDIFAKRARTREGQLQVELAVLPHHRRVEAVDLQDVVVVVDEVGGGNVRVPRVGDVSHGGSI